jgi:hypothetical protein
MMHRPPWLWARCTNHLPNTAQDPEDPVGGKTISDSEAAHDHGGARRFEARPGRCVHGH